MGQFTASSVNIASDKDIFWECDKDELSRPCVLGDMSYSSLVGVGAYTLT